MKSKIVVIGGGAAGMMAAISAARNGANVTLLEPNHRLGMKLNITGKGRCNVTNNATQEELLNHMAKNGRFLYSAFSRFDGKDCMSFFEELKVPLKTERGNRVFPVSDRSFDVSNALEWEMERLKVRVMHTRATALEVEEEYITSVATTGETLYCDAAIIATGGLSYPTTGSTGDGYELAKSVGHTVTDLAGSLVPLLSPDSCCKDMQGLALRNISMAVVDEKGKKAFQDFGELLFTHFGVTGPLVLSASAHMHDFSKNYRLVLDLKPALSEEKLEARLLRDMKERANQNVKGLVGGLVPSSMVMVIIRRCNISQYTKVHSITKEQRQKLISVLKGFEIAITGARPVKEAVVTTGGVSIREVNPNTMESKLVKGLYFAGEVLDVDAYTGGFNLQIAWATGKAAGEAAAQIGEE
ncbi:NAD(P)/FAD-dependent oxidoreductase [Bengtsoniella intestinalis]|uniref:NAD(P)/FAD-dependent oxidoreductase n=1 Tax=Bengtsoniella intestinalis TaxID=3073143 RepID=UPI00391EEE8A